MPRFGVGYPTWHPSNAIHTHYRSTQEHHDNQNRRDTVDDGCVDLWLEWLDEQIGLQTVAAIGHRVVHGMHHTAPEMVTQELLDELRRIVPCDPQSGDCASHPDEEQMIAHSVHRLIGANSVIS